MTDCLISFGSNIGNSQQTISEALESLQSKLRTAQDLPVDLASSNFLITQPIGGPENQNAFVNGVARFQTELDPITILNLLHTVEQEFGRHRRIRWDSRTLDLDLLLYGDTELESGRPQVPHPRMSFRQFVLVPAQDVAADMIHPTCRVTLSELLNCVLTRKKNILLISDRANLDSIFGKQTILEINSNVTVTSVDECLDHLQPQSEFKLVVLDTNNSSQLQRNEMKKQVVELHRGPLLLLHDQSLSQVEVELMAAIETMKAI